MLLYMILLINMGLMSHINLRNGYGNKCPKFSNTFEPGHDKTYDKTCATREDSNQPAHLCSLIRVFTDCMCLLQTPAYPKRDDQEPL